MDYLDDVLIVNVWLLTNLKSIWTIKIIFIFLYCTRRVKCEINTCLQFWLYILDAVKYYDDVRFFSNSEVTYFQKKKKR